MKLYTKKLTALLLAAVLLSSPGCSKITSLFAEDNETDAAPPATENAAVPDVPETNAETKKPAAPEQSETQSKHPAFQDDALRTPKQPVSDYEEAMTLLAQAVTLAVDQKMVQYRNFFEPESVIYITGWYQALRGRVDGSTAITEEEAFRFQKALGYPGESMPDVPDELLKYGHIRIETDKNGVRLLSFPEQMKKLDELLGVRASLSIQELNPGEIIGQVVYHTEAGYETNYSTLLQCDPDVRTGSYPCRLTTANLYPLLDLSLIGDSLDFVREQNTMENLLSIFQNVRMAWYEGEPLTYSTHTTYFKWREQTAFLSYFPDAEGNTMAQGGTASMQMWNRDGRNTVEVNVPLYEQAFDAFPYAVASELILPGSSVLCMEDRGDTIYLETGDPISLSDDFNYSYRRVYLLDKGTLRIMQAEFYPYYGQEEYPEQPLFIIQVTTNVEEDTSLFFSDWDGAMKNVTLSFENARLPHGEDNPHITELEIPASWDITPYYDDIAYCYMQDNYTVPYEYPGDGVDIVIYATNGVG